MEVLGSSIYLVRIDTPMSKGRFSNPNAKQLSEWKARAQQKNAILPRSFTVSPKRIVIDCGSCGNQFGRRVVPNLSEPVFVCPKETCKARNWVPLRFNE